MRALAVLLLALVATACAGAAEGAPAARPSRAQLSAALRRDVTVDGLRSHLVALERIADRNGGTRAAGTPGYAESVRYVRGQLARGGYGARAVPFPFVAYEEEVERAREVSPLARDLRPEALDYSPSSPPGGVRAELAPSGNGCEQSDFGDVRNQIALVRRGSCFFSVKARNAGRAGALAVIVYNNRPGGFDGTLGDPNASRIPAVGIAAAVGESLARTSRATVFLEVQTRTQRTSSQNVIAGSAAGRVLVLGAHLDSVRAGAGINDNATGVAALIEIAKALRRHDRALRVRFAFWGAEELGLIGSRAYVERLRPHERAAIAGYLNFDMLGSRRFVRGVYAGPFAETFLRYFRERKLATRTLTLGGGSDHTPFARAGIRVGGLYAGGDACYHRACDRVSSVNLAGLHELADAAAHAAVTLAPS